MLTYAAIFGQDEIGKVEMRLTSLGRRDIALMNTARFISIPPKISTQTIYPVGLNPAFDSAMELVQAHPSSTGGFAIAATAEFRKQKGLANVVSGLAEIRPLKGGKLELDIFYDRMKSVVRG